MEFVGLTGKAVLFMATEGKTDLFVDASSEACTRIMLDRNTRYPLFERAVRTYVYERFHLDQARPLEDDFDTLADVSISVLLKEKAKGKLVDTPSLTCDGATSADTKRVLLILVLQKALGVKVDPDESVYLTTIPTLARELYRLVQAKENRVEQEKGA